MISVIASIIVKEDTFSSFLSIFQDTVANVLAEDGCIEYIPMVDADVAIGDHERVMNKVTVLEKWESAAHLEVHLQAPHMLTYREAVKNMVESVSLSILEPAE